MEIFHKYRFLLVFFFSILLILSPSIQNGRAEGGDDETVRQSTVVVSYTRSKWWLIRWIDNQILCTVLSSQENLPTADEIFESCGETIFEFWENTPACTVSANDCEGAYLHLVDREPAEKTITVDLPPAVVNLTIENCANISANNICSQTPSLVLTGEEPIPGETITSIQGYINGEPFTCEGSECEIVLDPTPKNGVWIDFWAESSFGDQSEIFTALVRIIETGISVDSVGSGWYVDVISSQWSGEPIAVCAQLWDVFPPIGDQARWITTPAAPELIATDKPYYYLAGRLIANRIVDASSCPSGGLQLNGYADECGLEKAMPEVYNWQNQFDEQILDVAKQITIPAQLLKNIFAQESQFWPGVFKDPNEFGLGQLTDSGAETILLWNTRFFHQFCPTIFDSTTCERGYVYLEKENQQVLRGALAKQVHSDCEECTSRINMETVEQSITLFANTLVANCAQVSRILYNNTGRSPGLVSDYENLWQLTAANYHIGPGCISYAVYNTWIRRQDMVWANIQNYLTPSCESAVEYVDKITD